MYTVRFLERPPRELYKLAMRYNEIHRHLTGFPKEFSFSPLAQPIKIFQSLISNFSHPFVNNPLESGKVVVLHAILQEGNFNNFFLCLEYKILSLVPYYFKLLAGNCCRPAVLKALKINAHISLRFSQISTKFFNRIQLSKSFSWPSFYYHFYLLKLLI